MVNYIWAFFVIVGILYSLLNGKIDLVNSEIINSASSSIEMILSMLPIMCLWLGIMNIAKESGLLNIFSKKMSPLIYLIFKEIPKDHEAIGLISSNILMNMLGLGNAATPFGLKTMKSLQELNSNKDSASRSMITFLVINTCCITIIPTTVISFRLLNGANNPTDIVLASILTSVIATILSLIIDRLFFYLERRKDEYI